MKWSWSGEDLGDGRPSSERTPGYTPIPAADPEEEIPQQGQPGSGKRSWWMPPSWQKEEKAVPVASAVDPEISPEPPPPELEAEENRWIALANKGELCIYTCLSLKIGSYKQDFDFSDIDWTSSRHLASTFMAPVALQVLVPGLMLMHEMRGLSSLESIDSPAQGIEFRMVGFILYLYSIRNMYNNALDECRAVFLEMALEYNLPVTYVWPLVLGELINSFASFTLCLTLFIVFRQALNMRELVINCIAINFIGNVDIEFCSPQMKETAVKTFQNISREQLSGDQEPESFLRSLFENFLAFTLWSLRTVGTVGIGTFLACVFLFSS